MIEAETTNLAALARRLSNRANQLAEAAAENRLHTRRRDPVRWRRAELLWPLFWKGR